MDPCRPVLRPSVRRLRDLCCLSRCSFTCVSCPWNSKDSVAHQPLCSWPCCRKSLIWRCIYCNTICPGRGRFKRRLVNPERLYQLYSNWECITCALGDLCNVCRVSRRVTRWRGRERICWCGYHHTRNVLPLLSLHDRRPFFAREVSPEQGSLLFTRALSVTFFDRSQLLSAFFDGLCGAVVGVIAIIAAQILKSSVEGPVGKVEMDPISVAYDRISQGGPAAVLYILALAVLYKFSNKYTALLLLISGAIAGQFIFIS